jgi:hypothetical protein
LARPVSVSFGKIVVNAFFYREAGGVYGSGVPSLIGGFF